MQRIHDQLVAIDPTGAAVSDANTAACLGQLDTLDEWSGSRSRPSPPENRKLVTFHEAYPYFAIRHGFQLIGVITPSPARSHLPAS
jgi:manganese/iron transport system substrate-binding protein